jgi:hypothetical protein
MWPEHERNILAKLERDGPIDMTLSLEELQSLRECVYMLWQQPKTWGSREQQLILAYLRGYTLYRELEVQESQFWPRFHSDLGSHLQAPPNDLYDALEKAMKSDPRIAGLFITRSQREFVMTMNHIWGIRALRAAELVRLFKRYYLRHAGSPITEALMRDLLAGTDPAAIEVALRQRSVYQSLFHSLTRIVQTIIEQDWSIEPFDASVLIEQLQNQGINISTPNPILFFEERAPNALAELIADLRRIPRIRQVAKRTAQEIHVRLKPGYVYASQPVTLEFDRLPTGIKSLKMMGSDTERELQFSDSTVTLTAQHQFPPGPYQVQVFINDEPITSALEMIMLPDLIWDANTLNAPLIEGQFIVGEVRLRDGQYEVFRWQPQIKYANTQWQVMATELQVILEPELTWDVQAELETEVLGFRWVDPNTHAILDVLTVLHPEKLALQVSPALTGKRLVAYLESNPADIKEISPMDLSPLTAFEPEGDDRLVLELRGYKGRVAQRLGAIPTRVDGSLISLQHGLAWERL